MVRSALKISIYLFMFLSFSSYAHGEPRRFVEGEIIVKLKGQQAGVSGQSFMGKAQSKKGLKLKNAFSRMGVYHFQVKPGQEVDEAINELKDDPEVEYAEPNYIYGKATVGTVQQTFSSSEVSAMSNSSSSTYLATDANIQVQSSWGVVSHNGVPVVAVIDTGLDLNHSVFSTTGAIWQNSGEVPGNGIDDDHNGYIDDVNGWNFVSNTSSMYDDDGHGTHVSGIILGVTQDIYNPPYPAATIKIMPLKFLDGDGFGKTSDAIKAIYYAVNNGATVLNNSWGGPSYSSALHEAITYAYNSGVTFVAAAGNSGTNNDSAPMYPSSYNVPNIISVAATLDSDVLASFSNYGKNTVHLASPGVYILSTLPGAGYGSMSGTSMATPFVAGLAALMKSEKPDMLGYQVKQIIMNTTDLVVDGGGHPLLNNKVSSEGRMNVYSAVQSAKVSSVDASQPSYSFSNQDRGLASSIAASGCGLVSKMVKNGRGGPGGGSPAPESWGIFLILTVFALPLIIYNALRKKNPAQRRVHERYKIESEVKVKLGDRELVASVSSISQGGVQINTDALLDQGGIVSMVIRSPDGQEQIAVEGRVVWSESQKAYGVQFAETSQTIRERISSWTKALAKVS
ncbi:MAG: S8 family serine peptidase [Bdellovibrionales bacterium]|nr:S8 family serine peptidase [Bdellovibrionales bacterium]